ncbi:MAG: hypothetical protein H7256_16230 [Bdellovibrio sp.]|nr:hypothetical protein [Bdellovibrio sp.]
MKRLIHFSAKSYLTEFEELADFKKSFEVFSNDENLSAEEILKKEYDVIELGPGDFEKFIPHFHSLDYKISRLLVADALIKMGDIYQPINLIPDAIYATVTEKVPSLKIAEPAVIIGEYDFLLAMTHKLAQCGFLKIIIALADPAQGEKIRQIISHYIFGVQVVTISLEELTQLDSSNGLLVINIDKQSDPEAYESITYFNFLTPNAVFVDMQSRTEDGLVEEARRAELMVFGEVEILKTKYQSILELL